MDLNFDVQIMILEQFSFMELLSLADVNRHFQYVVEEIMKGKFAQKSVILGCPYHSEALLSTAYECETEDRVEISYVSVAQIVLARFGHLILNLKILHHYDLYHTNETKKVFELVNLHCSKSLIQLDILNKNTDAFAEFKQPFEKVEFLRLDGSFKTLDNTNLTFTEIFPSLRGIALLAIGPSSTNVFDEAIPRLEALQTENGNQHRTNTIKKIIQKNPQIRDLAVQNIKSELLKFIADRLPQLEHLELDMYDEGVSGNDTLKFENLKSLKMKGSRHTLPANVVFRDLEDFETDGLSRLCTRWMNLVESQKTLKRLQVNRPLENFEIQGLANAHVNLIEMVIQCAREVNIENVVMMINNTKQLKLIYLFFELEDLRQSAFDALKKRFEHEWQIFQIGYSVIMGRQ